MTDAAPGGGRASDAGRQRGQAGRAVRCFGTPAKVGLLVLTSLVPGAGHLLVGRRRVGLVATACSLVVWAAVAVVALRFRIDPGTLVSLALDRPMLLVLAGAAVVVVGAEMTLLAQLWWVLRAGSSRSVRVGLASLTVVIGVLIVVLGAGLGGTVLAQRNLLAGVFADGAGLRPHDGRYNILVLGVDTQLGGARADSITVASIDARTGATVLFAVPRDMRGFAVEAGSPLASVARASSDCGEQQCPLNFIYQYARDHPELYPASPLPGAQAVSDAVESLTGLSIGGAVVLDFNGFSEVVDAVGGIDVQVNVPVTIGVVRGPNGEAPLTMGTVEPGPHHFDGSQALWFVRSRLGSDNDSRMERQMCVVQAVGHRVKTSGAVQGYLGLLGAGQHAVTSTVPARSVPALTELVMSGGIDNVRIVRLVPPVTVTLNPNEKALHLVVQQALAGVDVAAAAARSDVPTQPDRVTALPFEDPGAASSPTASTATAPTQTAPTQTASPAVPDPRQAVCMAE
jgi:LCP family protein required for cell wall assembly